MAAADPALHTFAVSGAFVLGAVVGAVVVVRLVKYLTAYLRRKEGPDDRDS